MKHAALAIALMLFSGPASAAPCVSLDEQAARAALSAVQEGATLVRFCRECGMDAPEEIVVREVGLVPETGPIYVDGRVVTLEEFRASDSNGMSASEAEVFAERVEALGARRQRLVVNGEDRDLAELFLPSEGDVHASLALVAGCPVEGVAPLPEIADPAPSADARFAWRVVRVQEACRGGCCLRGEWSLARGVDLFASSDEGAATVSRAESGERLTPLALERHASPDTAVVLWARVEDEEGRAGWLRDPEGVVESLTRCD